MADATLDAAPVIIVSGLPRSGTSMTMKMLDAGGIPVVVDGIRVADDDNIGGYYEFEPVKQLKSDTSWLAKAGGKAVKMVYRLLYDLPSTYQYRVLFMRRKLDEVLASQRIMLERQGKAPQPGEEAQLAELFRMELSKVEAWLKRQPNFQVIDVNYNELVLNPRDHLPAIGRFLGGNFDVEAAATIVDVSKYRNRR